MGQPVKTFVIFDTETTGLPSSGNNPRITELSFIALLRDELLVKSRAPRVVNKLLLCFNPQRQISLESSLLTGLHNDALEAYNPFQSHASLICSFLTNLPQPACLVAHNGNRFDFPLIISELKNAQQPVPVNILCADSLEGFRELDGLPKIPEFSRNKRNIRSFTAVTETPNSNKTFDPISFQSVSPSKQARLPDDVHQLWSKDTVTPPYSFPATSSQGHNIKLKQGEIVRDDATNKARKNLFPDQASGYEIKKHEFNCSSDSSESPPFSSNKLNVVSNVLAPNTPQTPDVFSPWSTNIEAGVIQAAEMVELNFESDLGRTPQVQTPQETPKSISFHDRGSPKVCPSSNNINNNQQKSLSYSLPILYKRIFGQEPVESHTAEDDCKTLLSIILTRALPFCQWCDQNAELLGNLKPMY